MFWIQHSLLTNIKSLKKLQRLILLLNLGFLKITLIFLSQECIEFLKI